MEQIWSHLNTGGGQVSGGSYRQCIWLIGVINKVPARDI